MVSRNLMHRKARTMARLIGLFSVFSFAPAIGADEERIQACDFVGKMLEASSTLLSDSYSKQEVIKLWEIEREKGGEELSGQAGDNFVIVGQASTVVASAYREKSKLDIDWSHRCLTGDQAPAEIMVSWAGDMVEQMDPSSLPAKGDFIDPRDHRKVFGEEVVGLHSLEALTRRESGKVSACSLQFSHTQYEELYALGGMVKTSGTVNVVRHPTQVIIGMLKVKGEDLKIRNDGSLVPATFKIGGTYMTSNGSPLLGDTESMECEDDGFICNVNSDGNSVLGAVADHQFGFAYNRVNGSTDVPVTIEPESLDTGLQTMAEFYVCLEELGEVIRAEFANASE